MATVISNNRLKKHTIDKYNFKVLAIGGANDDNSKVEKRKSNLIQSENTVENSVQSSGASSPSSEPKASESSKDTLIESLMKKTDEMTSNFIKLQMKLEEKEEEFKQELEKAKKESYEEGFEAGKVEASSQSKENYDSGLNQFSSSVATLEESAKNYEKALENIKEDLISAALDISKEVINKELNESSQEIAKVLSTELIKELQNASKITLKVNPKDHGYISEKVGSLEHVEVVSDSAVSQGGVVAISDVGNIDAQISNRFEKVKKAALSE